ncbi:MAG: hypothetical protein QM715_05540 [Nibricoccus sp.]
MSDLVDFGWPTSFRPPQLAIMRARRLLPFIWLAFFLVPLFAADTPTPYRKVTVETSSTSIYIGKVTLNVGTLTRENGYLSGDYKAKVFPYWFMGEHGTFRLKASDEDFARIAKGEVVEFAGEAQNSDKEIRKITGRATPADAATGKFKVRIFVTEKIQLIFNSTYKFGE